MSLYLRFKTKGFLIIKITAHKFNFMTSFDMIAIIRVILRWGGLWVTQYLKFDSIYEGVSNYLKFGWEKDYIFKVIYSQSEDYVTYLS